MIAVQQDSVFSQILDAAMDLMASDAASIQMLAPDGESLSLVAWKHFDPASAEFWQHVTATAGSTCGRALRDNERVLVTDIEACEFMRGTQDLVEYRRSGIRAVQSTPLRSRAGHPLGMLSTHWHTVPSAIDDRLKYFDIVARQAAALIERVAAEEVLSSTSQRLIEAQEAERRRVAFELHDGINPRLLMLNMRLAALTQSLPASIPDSRRKIEEACEEVEQIGRAVQAVSYRLHPPRLEFLGAAAAAESLCRETSRQHGVEISFHAEDVPENLEKRIRVCLYRVLQEALLNAIRHSGTRKIVVSLCRPADRIELTVVDFGVGFDPVTHHRRGVGLTSMKERLKAIDGDLAISSFPEHGTSIRARVPVRKE